MSKSYLAKGPATIIDTDAQAVDPTKKGERAAPVPKMLVGMDKYWSKDIATQEDEKIFAKTWLCAGRESDVQDVGDWFKFDIGYESIIVVKSTDGVIRAFYNVCQHRGAQLVVDDAGNASKFVCGFHSWTWMNTGELHRIADEETFASEMICDRPGLQPVALDMWSGFIFISLDPNPPPLHSYLTPLPEQLSAYRMEDMVLISDVCVEWNVNWKTALDAFMEGYHIHRRHPEGLGWIEDYHLQHDFFDNGHSRMILPVPVKSKRLKDQHALNDELRAMLSEVGLSPESYEGKAGLIRHALQQRKREWAKEVGLDFSGYSDSQLTDDWNYFVFPNMTFNAHAEGVLVMRFFPNESDPEKCYYHVSVLAHRVDDPNYRMPRYMGAPDIDLSGEVPRPPRIKLKHGEASLSQVLDQDAEFVPRVQKGMKSRGFKGQRLSHQEMRMQAFYEEYDRYMRGK